MIYVDQLNKSYGDFVVVRDLHLEVKSQTAVGVLGPNGAGKTTTIECILGTVKPDCGKIRIMGLEPQKQRKQIFEQVGVQFQEASYQEKIKVYELCQQMESLYHNTMDYKELLQQFGLRDKEESYVKELSGGQRQKLFVLLTLIPNPKIVFLDEVSTGLDVKSRREVWRILRSLKKRGLTVLMSSHFMDEVEALCDYIYILNNGTIVFNGTVKEAIEQSPYDNLESAYLWYVEQEVIEDENFF